MEWRRRVTPASHAATVPSARFGVSVPLATMVCCLVVSAGGAWSASAEPSLAGAPAISDPEPGLPGRESAASTTCPLPAAMAAASPSPASNTDGRFISEFTSRHQAPARTVDIHHLRLEIALDLEGERIAGTARLTLSPLAVPRDRIVLHARELEIESVEVGTRRGGANGGSGATGGSGTNGGSGANGGSGGDDEPALAAFDLTPDRLAIDLPRIVTPAETLTVAIRYAAAPRLGLYFVRDGDRPGGGGGGKVTQVWSQGESEDNRHWFPGWDHPSDRFSSEMIVTVPDGLTAVSNGTLRERRPNPDGTVTFHWYEEHPHVNYLVSLAVGRFDHAVDSYRDVQLDYLVPRGMKNLVGHSFDHTPDMMRIFEEAFAYPYPFARYAQTAVFDFRWGGMENLSATTLTVRSLHDEAAALTYDSDDLVAHELAHQWFGDLVTCRSWAELWLNEGLATFAELVYFEERWGEDGRFDRLQAFRDDYLAECEESYRRPLVTDVYAESDDLFDAHSYQKGALVMHMLRAILGEEVFWHGLHLYLEQNAWQLVETTHLRLAFEEASGRDLTSFFDQWVYHAGHPVLEARWDWDEELAQLCVQVDQTQPMDDRIPLFEVPFDLRVVSDDGSADHRLRLAGAHGDYHVPAARHPRYVQIDPHAWLLAEIDLEQPTTAWLAQLGGAPEVSGRVVAAGALGTCAGDPAALAGLGSALRTDPSRHVRAAAASALGELGTRGALAELVTGVGDADARVRRSVASALGECDGELAVATLLGLIDGDPSPYVVGDALVALGETQAPGALEVLAKATRRLSHASTIQKSAYRGMAATENEAAYALLLEGCAPEVGWVARQAAIESLGKLASTLTGRRAAIRETLTRLTGDPHFGARRAATTALGETGDPEALPVLRRLARHAYEPGVRCNARAAVRELLAPGDDANGATPAELERQIEELDRDNRQLREDLETLRRELAPAR